MGEYSVFLITNTNSEVKNFLCHIKLAKEKVLWNNDAIDYCLAAKNNLWFQKAVYLFQKKDTSSQTHQKLNNE